LRTLVWSRTDVISVGTSRVDEDSVLEPSFCYQALKHTFRRGRAADVTHAYKEDSYLVRHP